MKLDGENSGAVDISTLQTPDPATTSHHGLATTSVLDGGSPVVHHVYTCARVDQLPILGMVIPPLMGNPYSGYINPYYWVDDHSLLHGNNGSLDPSTHSLDASLATCL